MNSLGQVGVSGVELAGRLAAIWLEGASGLYGLSVVGWQWLVWDPLLLCFIAWEKLLSFAVISLGSWQ